MLSALGLKSVREFFRDVPEEVYREEPLNLCVDENLYVTEE